MATPSSMILHSLRLIGEKVVGGTLTSAEQTDYLADLNSMLESWSVERLMVPSLLQESFALSTSVGSYTIGSGGAFNTTRPTRICDPIFIRDSSNYDYPVAIIDADTYAGFFSKTQDGVKPRYLFYDGADVAGLGTIFLYPEPAASLTLFINSWKQLQSFASISTSVVLQTGYQRAIEFNFAVESAGGFKNVSPDVAKIAKDSKASLKGFNAPSGIMALPAGVAGHRRPNILIGL